MNKFKMVAKTLTGLEEILATEIEAIGGINIEIGTRMVSYVGDKKLLYKSNLWLRTALRILKPIETFKANNPDELYAYVKNIDWQQYVEEGQTIAIDATINSDNFRHSRYAIYRTKDAICDHFVENGMKRPKISVATADVQINLHISNEHCTLSLDSSGEPLYKRGYKAHNTEAPISEVLAAGILLKAGWNGQRDLIDPMCGSGTFLIEAALIATNTPAGIYRKNFGFERWSVGELAFDAELWGELYEDDSQERPFEHHIYGSDISRVALETTEQNIKSAGLGKYISLEVKDFETYETCPSEGCMLVCNPPYGKRLFTDVPTFYKMMGSTLKRAFAGCEAWIISIGKETVKTEDRQGNSSSAEPFDFIGLKPSAKITLNNGGIDCELRKYEMFKGKFDAFRAEGNSLEKKTVGERKDSKFDHQKRERTGRPAGKDDRRRTGRPTDDRRRDGQSRDNQRRPAKPGAPKPGRRPAKENPAERNTGERRRVRKFDPNRPMFADDFDPSKNVLDFTDNQ